MGEVCHTSGRCLTVQCWCRGWAAGMWGAAYKWGPLLGEHSQSPPFPIWPCLCLWQDCACATSAEKEWMQPWAGQSPQVCSLNSLVWCLQAMSQTLYAH